MVRVVAWTAAVAALGVVAVVPADRPLSIAVYHGAALTALLVLGVGVLRRSGPARAVWTALWLAQAAYVAGDVIYDVQQFGLDEVPFPGWADLAYLVFYLGQLTAMALLIKRRSPRRDRDAWLDTAIMSAAAATVVAAFVLVPLWRTTEGGPEGLLALAYPLADVVLATALIALLVLGGWHPALGVVLMSELVMLVADFGYDLLVITGEPTVTPGWLQALFLLSPMIMAAAVWEPTAATIADVPAGHDDALSRARIVGLALGVMVPSLLLTIVIWDGEPTALRLLSLGTFAVIGLVVWRVLLLFGLVRRQQHDLAQQARTDALTGLANRRTWDFESERAGGEAMTSGAPLSVAILDLDHFKDFNDSHGHQRGDVLLAACAQAWRTALPPGSFLARYGGEEFAVLLPGWGLSDAAALLDGVRAATPDRQTVSVGVAQWEAGESIGHTVDRADQALYAAKDGGRDQVRTHEGLLGRDAVGRQGA